MPAELSELEINQLCQIEMGWEKKYGTPQDRDALIPGLQVVYFRNERLGIRNWRGQPPPDYTCSLDAAATLRVSLTEDERDGFIRALLHCVKAGLKSYWDVDWDIANATALQICRAYLRCKNLI